nr:phosphonate ABC transporter ATP-binding protein [Brevibacterium album]
MRIRNVTKEFTGGAVRALNDITLDVPTGQRLVLMGLSGSGKSTTLRLINALAEPTRGEVEVLGQNPSGLSSRELRQFRRQIGFVFQHFNLVGRASALENVLVGALGGLRGPRYGIMTYPDSLRREALRQLERVGLADKAFQRASTLSGGQQQRVGIARALLQRPKIVLADEPVASLDPESSRQIMDLLFEVCDQDGLTVICNLHQMEIALGWADRMVGLRSGEIILDRDARTLTPEDVSEIYAQAQPQAAS